MLDKTVTLRWELFQEYSTSSIEEQWKNGSYLDVTIACDDGQIGAHKVILSAASPIFEKILLNNPHVHPLLYLRGTRKKNMEALLRFIYSGTTEVFQQGLSEFMELASGLDVKGLGNKIDLPVIEILETIKDDEVNEEFNSNLVLKREQRIEVEENLLLIDESATDSKTDILDEMKNEWIPTEDEDTHMNVKMEEYELRVAELMRRTDDLKDWTCVKCPFTSHHKSHVTDHVDSHLVGFTFICGLCESNFGRKKTLRKHVSRCKKKLNQFTKYI